MGPPAASPGETFQLWFGCLLQCPGAHSHLGEEDAGICPWVISAAEAVGFGRFGKRSYLPL